jgi:hypothetical protein
VRNIDGSKGDRGMVLAARWRRWSELEIDGGVAVME